VCPGIVVRWGGDFILIEIGYLSVQYSLIQVKIIVTIGFWKASLPHRPVTSLYTA
jgi:hypothetical protein